MLFIITADWHLRKDIPRCRLDENWVEYQFKIIQTIIDEVKIRNANLCIVGDLFHQSVVPEELKNKLIISLKQIDKNIFIILPGNHCLPYHSYANLERSSFGIINKIFPGNFINENYPDIQAAPFDMDKTPVFYKPTAKIVFTHQLTFASDKDRPFPDIGKTAQDLLNEYPSANWIFTGDNHKGFVYQKDGRTVINPGCISRQASDFIDYQPTIYFVDTESGQIDKILLPDSEPMVTDKYIQEENAREDRIESFVSSIRKQGKVSLNFRENLIQRRDSKEVDIPTREIITELLEQIPAGE